MKVVGVILKEVVVENAAQPGELSGVYALFFEDFVHIGPVAAEFFRQPGHGVLLAVEFLLDEMTDVYHGWREGVWPLAE